MSNLSAYKASAGSGKTFTLTREYIFLLFENKNNFQHILAVTFTNKACGEMKSRILSQLHRLASGNPTPFAGLVAGKFGLDEVQVRDKAGEILNTILHNYSFFHVETIDKFFHGVVTNFAKELGIRSLQNIELDTNRVLENTITQLFINIDDNPDLKLWLNEYVSSQVERGENFDVRRNVFKLCQNLFKESVASKITESSAFFDDKDAIEQMYDSLEKTVSDFESRMSRGGKQALELMAKHGLDVADYSYGKNGFANYFNKIQDGDYEPSQRVLAALEDPGSWSSKASAKKAAIAASRDAGLLELLRGSVELYNSGTSDYNTAALLVKYRHVFPVISKISAKVLDYCRENGIHLLSSNNLLLKSIIDGNPTPFVYEKTGAYLRHFMLDEFQDTSLIQWENIRPLVENSLAEDNRSLVVGDVKQSIYRWRNGDWTLLGNRIYDDFPGGVDTFTLDTNYRSARRVVEFNNSFFGMCRASLQQWVDAQVAGSGVELPAHLGDVMQKAYGDLEQQPGGPGNVEGYVSVSFCEAARSKDFDAKVAEWLPRTIERLQDHGYKASDIAVIVRKNQECKNVVDCLLGHKQQADPRYCFDVVSAEGLALQNSSAVMIIISILSAWGNPSDTLSRAFVVQEYGLKFRGKDINQLVAEHQAFDAFMAEHGLDVRQAVSLYERCEIIIHKLGLAVDREVPFLKDFLDHVLSFTVNASGSAHSFLKWWKEKGAKLSVSLPGDQPAIQVLTIHKSKGLEFKAVVLPYCNWDLFNYKLTMLWPSSPSFDFPFHPVDFRKDLAKSDFKGDYVVEMVQQLLDNLNLVYVAFTRAEEALCILTRNQKPGGGDCTSVADLMSLVYDGKPGVEWGTLQSSGGEAREGGQDIPCVFPTPGMSGAVVFATRGVEFFDSFEGSKGPRAWGKVMHEVLSGVERKEDLGLAVERAVAAGLLSADESAGVRQVLSAALEHPAVGTWFDGSSYFLPESSILCPSGELKRPDRIMIRGNEATVVDYKFGSMRDLPAHKRQVRGYMSLLGEMGYATSGYVWYVEGGVVEAVEAV